MAIRVLAALLLALALAAAGCGGEDEDRESVSRALGGLSDADASQLEDWSADVRKLGGAQADMLRGFSRQNVKAARAGLDDLETKVRAARDSTAEFDSAKVKAILSDYMTPIERYVGAAERFVVVWEKETASGVPTPDAEVERLVGGIRRATQDVQRNESSFVARLEKEMSPEQREKLRSQLADATEKFQERAGVR